MRHNWLLIATAMLLTCAATSKFDLSNYFSDPPIAAPLVNEATLLGAYGAGCTKSESSPSGGPYLERHAYFDASTGRWIEASVQVDGPESRELVGVLVTSVSLCTEKSELRAPFAPTGARGVHLGDPIQKALARLGSPLRTETGQLGQESTIQVLEYFPEKSNPAFCFRLHVLRERVVAISFVFTE